MSTKTGMAMKSLIESWQGRTRIMRGKELRDYEAFWEDWHAKYDRYATRNRKHFLNSVSLPSEYPHNRAVCICGAEYVNAPDDQSLLRAFQAHLDKNEPERVDLAQIQTSPAGRF